ncbi:histidine kinase [Luteipulveratus sp. YIM 133132]|uniref:histidine kinase n=1 Tax=Luteipulveratus flavus TaxID=3031728 RepID=A0ABT6C5V5_9MICO|nr:MULTISPECIES: histidine kinase [unclassified Luteipulveratus]MDE9366426.1 histidine kinase [Luteipulveratus sp. YIM 133132]MDF8264299.1 histidine kinase [Luteipulveratus sp. YIM 133296]
MSAPTTSRARHLWGETWRILAAAVSGLLLLAAAQAEDRTQHYQHGDVWPFVDLALGVLSLGLLLWRRRWPVAITGTLVAVSAVAVSPAGAAGLALISLCTHRRWRQIVPMTVLWILSSLIFALLFPSQDALSDRITNVVLTLLATAVCVATGLAIGARRELLASLRARAETAEREQALLVARAKVGERARIAREMHDVLAHRISLVAVHSGALAYRQDLSATEVRTAAGVIQENAHHALTELREVLGVLRGNEAPGEPEAPQPVLCDVEALVESARRGGAHIDLRVHTDPSGLPEPISRHAYRIIQEGLTNAAKHAPGAPVIVEIAGEPGGRLLLEVRNPEPPHQEVEPLPSSGLGLIGLTERAVLSGGELRYGVDRRQHFVLSAWLPWAT